MKNICLSFMIEAKTCRSYGADIAQLHYLLLLICRADGTTRYCKLNASVNN